MAGSAASTGSSAAWMLKDFLAPDGIEAVDPYTVRFKLNRPYAAFLSFVPLGGFIYRIIREGGAAARGANTEHCENLRQIPGASGPLSRVREAGPPRTKEFDFGPLRLELVRQAA